MTAPLVLWGHALAALLFVAAALGWRGRGSAVLPGRAVSVALVLTALWALAVAGIDARDVATRLMAGMRDVAWLVVLLVAARRGSPAGGVGRTALHLVAIGLAVLVAAVAVAEPVLADVVALRDVRLTFHALQLLAGLMLVHGLASGAASSPTRLVGSALALVWGVDLALVGAVAAGSPSVAATLLAARGPVLAGAALLLAMAASRRDEDALAISRTATARLLLIVVLAGYAAIVALLTAAAQVVGGEHARLAQAAVVFGATAALLTLLSTPWLRGWGKVMVAKHLFTHRYDYRVEWQRFSETLSPAGAATMLSPAGDGAPPLGERIARAMADLTVSPAALLLLHEGGALTHGAGWRWDAPFGDGGALAAHLAASQRIVELDTVRAGAAPPDERDAVPPALTDDPDAWAVVPLIHLGTLTGAVVLARPPLDRALDWEDFDLLRVAGRQAAGALAEDRARGALADAERFDEFNRRFAFILHDIKNLVSQLSLVARNAERHADNPAFRADMVATLRGSSERMQALLARLSPHAPPREPVRPVDAARLVDRLGARHGGTVEGHAPRGVWLLADEASLDTVLDHLVQNARDASPEGFRIKVRLREEAERVAIVVADRGCGMEAGFVRDRLFRPFASTKPGGFGLGAYEARQMVEAMDGRLLVDSRPGEGTRMTVVLPRAVAPVSVLAA